jgi:predicted MFS family arabinose efflux permease
MDADVAVKKSISKWLIALLAASCGLIVANLYYAQPLVGPIRASLGISADMSGLIVTITQIGYVVALLFIVPLSDLIENRRLAVSILTIAVFALLLAGFAHQTRTFFIAAFLIGLGSVVVQVLVPYTAHLSAPEEQGRTVGSVMSGLLLGIMFARPISSFLAGLFRWNLVFFLSAGMMLVLIFLLYRFLPDRRPAKTLTYRSVIASLWPLFRSTPVLRRRAFYQACLFCSFSLFWTISPLWLAHHFYLSQTGIALFALAGVGGAVASPVAGRLADRGWTTRLTAMAFVVAASSFALTHLFQSTPGLALPVFYAAAILLDMSVSGNLVLGQQAIYALGAQTRGRMNSIFMSVFFVGGAIGSAAGGLAYAHGGWTAASLVGTAMPVLALAYFLTDKERHSRRDEKKAGERGKTAGRGMTALRARTMDEKNIANRGG